ncbi:MAG: FAD-binding oxidoreductase [Hyphomonadaceae bacterium]|nr:FAD-binding oxidoreductase [Hyphomonadaceae bacterium]
MAGTDRRTVLKLAAASAALAACSPAVRVSEKHVAVIGGGIIGASIAYHLTKAGMKVTLLERGKLAERASRGTFAWINATWAKQPRAYHAFNQDGLLGWHRLQSDLGIPVRWGGSLEWFETDTRQARLAEQIAEQVEWGEPAEMIEPEALRELEGKVDFTGVEQAAYSPNDGAVDPVLATEMLVAAAIELGATVQENCSVERVTPNANGQSVLQTQCGDLAVDKFVLATGADPEATARLAGLDIPQRSTPGVIVVTTPQPRLINRIIVAPGVHIHQRDDGRIVLGEQDGAPDTAAHMERLRDRPNRFPEQVFADQHAMRILSIAEQYVPGMLDADVEDVFIGWRPLPLDGHPVLGTSPANPTAYLAIMHSGVSLAPIVGEVVAQEISMGVAAEVLAPYRPGRDFAEVRRY